MIVVTVELYGAAGRSKIIGRMLIINDGSSVDARVSDYTVVVSNRQDAPKTDPQVALARPTRTGSVKGFRRLSYNVWRLVARSLLSAFPEEDPRVRR